MVIHNDLLLVIYGFLLIIFQIICFDNIQPLKFLNFFRLTLIKELLSLRSIDKFVNSIIRLVIFIIFQVFSLTMISSFGISKLTLSNITNKFLQHTVNIYVLLLLVIEGMVVMFLNFEITYCLVKAFRPKLIKKNVKKINKMQFDRRFIAYRVIAYLIGIILTLSGFYLLWTIGDDEDN